MMEIRSLRRIFFFVVLVSLASCCPSCSVLKKTIGLGLMRPKVRLESLRFEDVSRNTLRLSARLSVHNPNDVKLALSRLEYQVLVGNVLLSRGTHPDKLIFPAASTTEHIQIPIELRLSSPGELLKELAARGGKKFNLTWKSGLLFHSALGPVSLKYEDEKPLSRGLAGF